MQLYRWRHIKCQTKKFYIDSDSRIVVPRAGFRSLAAQDTQTDVFCFPPSVIQIPLSFAVPATCLLYWHNKACKNEAT